MNARPETWDGASSFGTRMRPSATPASRSMSRLQLEPTMMARGDACDSGFSVRGSVWSTCSWLQKTTWALVASSGASGGGNCRGKVPLGA